MSAAEDDVRVEYQPLGALVRWPRNPKQHDSEALVKSVERWGFIQPLLVDEATGRLTAGHGRLETLQGMKAAGKAPPRRVRVAPDGDWLVPVLRGVKFANEQEAEAYLLADNRLTQAGGWDDAGLAEMLSDLRDAGDSFEGVGWLPGEVDGLLEVAQSAEPDARPRGQTPQEQLETFKRGEIKQIVHYFDGDEYDGVVGRVQAIMKDRQVVSQTEVFMILLNHYEATSAK